MNLKYKYDEPTLRELVKKSVSMGHLLKMCNVIPAGGNYTTMKRRLMLMNIDTLHWGETTLKRQGWLKGKTHNWARKTPLSEILIEKCMWGGSSHSLKLRLIKEGIFQRKCYNCELTEWKDHPIPIELEHINGNKFDNRIENLTLNCPNCHALTPTYRRRKKKNPAEAGL